MLPDDAVALACSGLKAKPVENGHLAIPVMDQASLLQGAGSNGHAGSSDPEHQCHELMGYSELVTISAVMFHQKPAGETLFQRMAAIAHGCLRDLGVERLHVA